MKVTPALPFAALLAATTAKPVEVLNPKREAGNAPKGYGPSFHKPQPYGPPKPYEPTGHHGTGSISVTTITSTVPLSTGSSVSSSSAVGDPIGFTNSSSTPGTTGFTPSFSSIPRTATWTESSSLETLLTLTSRVTLTVTLPSLSTGISISFPSQSRHPFNHTTHTHGPYPTATGTPPFPVLTNPGKPPHYGMNTSSSQLTTGTTITTTIGTTSYVTIHNTTSSDFDPSFSSRPRTGTWSLTGSISSPIWPVSPTGAPHTSQNSSSIPSTAYPVHPTGPKPHPYPTAPMPYPYPKPSLSTGVTLSTAVSLSTGISSSSSRTIGDPIPNSPTSSTIPSVGFPPTTYSSPTLIFSTGVSISSSNSSSSTTIIDPIINTRSSSRIPSSGLPAPTAPKPHPYPNFGPDSSSSSPPLSDLDTFPTFALDPTTSYAASLGFSTLTTTTTSPAAPPTHGPPIPYATSSYAGPGGYPYSYGEKHQKGGLWHGWWGDRD